MLLHLCSCEICFWLSSQNTFHQCMMNWCFIFSINIIRSYGLCPKLSNSEKVIHMPDVVYPQFIFVFKSYRSCLLKGNAAIWKV